MFNINNKGIFYFANIVRHTHTHIKKGASTTLQIKINRKYNLKPMFGLL